MRTREPKQDGGVIRCLEFLQRREISESGITSSRVPSSVEGPLDIARGREIYSLMRAGAVDGLSIGFRTVKARRDRIKGVRRLEKIDLWEISVVTFPMLPEARVAAVKQQPPRGDPNDDARLVARLAAAARLLRSTHHPQRTI